MLQKGNVSALEIARVSCSCKRQGQSNLCLVQVYLPDLAPLLARQYKAHSENNIPTRPNLPPIPIRHSLTSL